jgi:glycosyltransferase involved in cell wall biosynthesis
MITLAIVSPCYNEELLVKESVKHLVGILETLISRNKISSMSKILLVDDGSSDNTWNVIEEVHNENHCVQALRLTSNVGHQCAILAGMLQSYQSVDAVITIDIDLQDDIYAIEKMVDDFVAGSEIVYGVKVNRDADPLLKRIISKFFYKTQKLLGINVIYNHADFRLLSSKVVHRLAEYKESNLYIRGIVTLLSNKTSCVEEVISKRKAGKSNYTVAKMINLASNGIFSFTTKPIEFIIYIGLAMMLLSLCMLIYVIVSFITGNYINGWASILLSIWFVGSVITTSIGILGTYIGKVFIEVKRRPLYNIEKELK